LFAYLIIRLFQLVFSARTVFFSHNKSAGTVFWLDIKFVHVGLYNHSFNKVEGIIYLFFLLNIVEACMHHFYVVLVVIT